MLQALDISKELGDASGDVDTLGMIADVYVEMGEFEKAVEAFEIALRDARAKSGRWEQELHRRMVQMKDRNTLALWASVVEATK